MTLPIRTLPIVEAWDCHGCGRCCRGTIIRLNDGDRERLRRTALGRAPRLSRPEDRHPPRLVETAARSGKRKDGRCIFLTEDGLCRIHREFGLAAKPLVCQMFPFQLVPLEDHAYLTIAAFLPYGSSRPGTQHRGVCRRRPADGRAGRAGWPPRGSAAGGPPAAVAAGSRRYAWPTKSSGSFATSGIH